MNGPYDDIIHLPHHVSRVRPQMPRGNRAAQFAPFAALSGYDEAIDETARLTGQRIELGEDAMAVLGMKLNILVDNVEEQPDLAVTYFLPDEKKDGGAYVTATGVLKKVDEYERTLVFMGGKQVAFGDILEIECGLFRAFRLNQ